MSPTAYKYGTLILVKKLLINPGVVVVFTGMYVFFAVYQVYI